MDKVIIPNKNKYSVGEIFDKLKHGSLYKKFAANNPKEAKMLEDYVNLRRNQLAGTSPLVSVFKTDTGQALYMALISAPSLPQND